MALPQFTTLSLDVRPEGYAVLELARPAKSNAVSTEMWDELPQVCSKPQTCLRTGILLHSATACLCLAPRAWVTRLAHAGPGGARRASRRPSCAPCMPTPSVQLRFKRLPAVPVYLRLQVVLCGKGKHFCAGIDFAALEGVVRVLDAKCPGRARERLFRDILRWQVQALSPCAPQWTPALNYCC